MTHKPHTRTAVKAQHTPNRIIPRPEVRLYLYRVLAAAGPLIVFYGLATTEEITLWLGVGATILATPTGLLAAGNVPRD